MTVIFGVVLIMSGCASTTGAKDSLIQSEQDNLKKFAYANCLLWYFRKNGYDESDISAIGGGYVEKSSLDAERFQKIALLMKDYSPKIESKNDIDPDLYKCFFIEENREINELISDLSL